jgi:Fe-only nitrogenase accessory protein AnfO
MDMKIAAFLDYTDETTSFDKSGIVKVYSKDKEEWNVVEEIPFSISNLNTSKEIRESIINMIKNLRECRVFVAARVIGICFTVLEGSGFNIWEVEGNPADFLEHVFESEQQEKLNKPDETDVESIPTPIQSKEEGEYYIDLKMSLERNEKVTSKQILLPFLKNTTFSELEIICGHIPPWFDKEFKRLHLKSSVESIRGDNFKVIVYPEK